MLGKSQKLNMYLKEKEKILHVITIGRRRAFSSILILETLILHHNLDVMHIEKNVCDSILGTF